MKAIVCYILLGLLIALTFATACDFGYQFGVDIFREFVPKYEQFALVG